jgi:hypothetical protein
MDARVQSRQRLGVRWQGASRDTAFPSAVESGSAAVPAASVGVAPTGPYDDERAPSGKILRHCRWLTGRQPQHARRARSQLNRVR